jgi:hypothetical protein
LLNDLGCTAGRQKGNLSAEKSSGEPDEKPVSIGAEIQYMPHVRKVFLTFGYVIQKGGTRNRFSFMPSDGVLRVVRAQ